MTTSQERFKADIVGEGETWKARQSSVGEEPKQDISTQHYN